MKLTLGQLEEAVTKIYNETTETDSDGCNLHSRDLDISVYESNGNVFVKVSQMYSYVPFSYKIIKQLVEVSGCEDINVDQFAYGGCETCDYGSSYEVEFEFITN